MTNAELHAATQAPTALPTDKELVMRVMPMPADSNMTGDIFGGWIMAQVDRAGSVLPARISALASVTTVAVNQFDLRSSPVSIGDLLSFYDDRSSAWAIRRSPCASRSTPNATRPTCRSSR